MSAATSVSGEFKLAKQSSQGSAATTGFLCGRMKDSVLLPAFDELNPGAEHNCGGSGRQTMQKSLSIRTGYMGIFSGSWFMYPQFIGQVLLGLGFGVSTSGVASAYTHDFTIASRDTAEWLTVIQDVGDGANAFGRKGVDGRIASYGFQANARGIANTFQGVCLDVTNTTGSETDTAEVNKLLTATDGTLTAEISAVSLVSTVRSISLQLTNPLYTQDVSLFSAARSDLPQLGVSCSGVLGGVDVSSTVWDKLYRNGSASGSPSLVIPSLDLTFKFESPENISGEAVPYSIQFDMPTCEVRMTPYGMSGRNLVRCGIAFNMYDPTDSEPITISLVNELSSY